MNRRQNINLATGAAAITALLLLVVLIYTARSGNTNPDIVLPPDPSEMHVPTSMPGETVDVNPFAPNLIEITPDNVKKIVADLSRPAEYSAVNKTTRFWDGGESSKTYRVYVLGECSRIDEYGAGAEIAGTVIYTPDTVYMPLGGQDQSVPRGEFKPDTAMAMPTYEDVLELGDIVGAGYVTRNARPCVWVQTQDGQGYAVEYWIDLECGLLVSAEARQNGLPAWKFEQSELILEKPGEDKFELTSGVSVLTQEQQSQ